jgi:prepilin-type N-terminal cleavage/methylation domain-containing protein
LSHLRPHLRTAAFTLFEVMIVVAIVAIAAAMALPSLRSYRENQALRAGVRASLDLFTRAKTLARAEHRNHVVLFAVGPGTDVCGNPIVDAQGNPTPILVIDDGPPGGGNCCIDAGEYVESLDVQLPPAVTWGAAMAAAPAPMDLGGGPTWAALGSSFRTPAGLAARGVLFRPDGLPVTFSNACAVGTTGSGAGALYVTNGNRDYAVVLSPIGALSVERFDPALNAWEN